MSRWDGCDTCTAWHDPIPFEEDMGENSEPIAFSKSHCHMNESKQCHLAGERYIIHVGKDNEHMEVCSDCYCKYHGVYEEENDGLKQSPYKETIKEMDSENND